MKEYQTNIDHASACAVNQSPSMSFLLSPTLRSSPPLHLSSAVLPGGCRSQLIAETIALAIQKQTASLTKNLPSEHLSKQLTPQSRESNTHFGRFFTQRKACNHIDMSVIHPHQKHVARPVLEQSWEDLDYTEKLLKQQAR